MLNGKRLTPLSYHRELQNLRGRSILVRKDR
jgi:hypothetical protein